MLRKMKLSTKIILHHALICVSMIALFGPVCLGLAAGADLKEIKERLPRVFSGEHGQVIAPHPA